jgi:hypothetical protein
MSSTVQTILKITLGLAIIGLSYYLYEIIQEPIRFEKIKEKRYSKIKDRLENIRDAQKVYRAEYGNFAKDFNTLIAFVDTGKQSIIERKDSSFMYYNKVYQQEMKKDTVVVRILGYQNVKENLFGNDFDPSQLRYIPGTDNKEFEMGAGRVEANQVEVPVFEAKAPNRVVFEDVFKKYRQFIDADYALTIGSLQEPTLSGNWK